MTKMNTIQSSQVDGSNLPLAVNPITGTTYAGGNQDELTEVFILAGYSTNQWCTYRQAKNHGGQVRKGERSTSCKKAGSETKIDDAGERSTRRFCKGFAVFNFDQIEWENGEGPQGSDDWSSGERVISDAPAEIRPAVQYPQTESGVHYQESGAATVCVRANAAIADKLRGLADAMQKQIAGKYADRLTNTPKRMRENSHQRMEGDRLARVQQAMRALADLHDAGEVPEVLHGINTKKAIYEACRSKTDHNGNGDYFELGEPVDGDDVAAAIWSLLKPKSAAEIAADDLKKRIDSLQFAKIPGYFPTPSQVVALMLDYADVTEEHKVLEPSAGSGAILDQLPKSGPLAPVLAFEANHTLAGILEDKGYNVIHGDFLEHEVTEPFDRVLMNPPFERQADIDHVLHAWGFLKDGGRLVSVMSPGFIYRSDKKAAAFREFVEAHAATVAHPMTNETIELDGVIELPEGSFKESGTGVNTVLLVLDK